MGRPKGPGRKTMHVGVSDNVYRRLWWICCIWEELSGPSAALEFALGTIMDCLDNGQLTVEELLAYGEAEKAARVAGEEPVDFVWSLAPETAERFNAWTKELGLRKRDLIEAMTWAFTSGFNEVAYYNFFRSVMICMTAWREKARKASAAEQ